MQKILGGLIALLVLAVAVGAATHWLVSIAVVVLPMIITFLRLKRSPEYRAATDKAMIATLGEMAMDRWKGS